MPKYQALDELKKDLQYGVMGQRSYTAKEFERRLINAVDTVRGTHSDTIIPWLKDIVRKWCAEEPTWKEVHSNLLNLRKFRKMIDQREYKKLVNMQEEFDIAINTVAESIRKLHITDENLPDVLLLICILLGQYYRHLDFDKGKAEGWIKVRVTGVNLIMKTVGITREQKFQPTTQAICSLVNKNEKLRAIIPLHFVPLEPASTLASTEEKKISIAPQSRSIIAERPESQVASNIAASNIAASNIYEHKYGPVPQLSPPHTTKTISHARKKLQAYTQKITHLEKSLETKKTDSTALALEIKRTDINEEMFHQAHSDMTALEKLKADIVYALSRDRIIEYDANAAKKLHLSAEEIEAWQNFVYAQDANLVYKTYDSVAHYLSDGQTAKSVMHSLTKKIQNRLHILSNKNLAIVSDQQVLDHLVTLKKRVDAEIATLTQNLTIYKHRLEEVQIEVKNEIRDQSIDSYAWQRINDNSSQRSSSHSYDFKPARKNPMIHRTVDRARDFEEKFSPEARLQHSTPWWKIFLGTTVTTGTGATVGWCVGLALGSLVGVLFGGIGALITAPTCAKFGALLGGSIGIISGIKAMTASPLSSTHHPIVDNEDQTKLPPIRPAEASSSSRFIHPHLGIANKTAAVREEKKRVSYGQFSRSQKKRPTVPEAAVSNLSPTPTLTRSLSF